MCVWVARWMALIASLLGWMDKARKFNTPACGVCSVCACVCRDDKGFTRRLPWIQKSLAGRMAALIPRMSKYMHRSSLQIILWSAFHALAHVCEFLETDIDVYVETDIYVYV